MRLNIEVFSPNLKRGVLFSSKIWVDLYLMWGTKCEAAWWLLAGGCWLWHSPELSVTFAPGAGLGWAGLGWAGHDILIWPPGAGVLLSPSNIHLLSSYTTLHTLHTLHYLTIPWRHSLNPPYSVHTDEEGIISTSNSVSSCVQLKM